MQGNANQQVANQLISLLQAGGKGIGNIASKIPVDPLLQLASLTPQNMMGSMLQTGLKNAFTSAAPQIQDWNSSVKQPTMRLPMDLTSMASQGVQSPEELAFQEGRIAESKKAGAMSARVDLGLEQPPQVQGVLDMLSSALATKPDAPGMKPVQSKQKPESGSTQAQPTQQPQPQGDDKFGGGDILQTMLTMLTGLPTPGFAKLIDKSQTSMGNARQQNINLQNQLLDQELKGEKPAQKGQRELKQMDIDARREEFKIEQFNNLLQTGNKALSAEASQKIGNIESGLEQVNLLRNAFEKDQNVFKQLATPGNSQAQIIKVMTEDLTDIIGRLRSGGAINADEEERFLGQIPKFGFIKGRTEAPGTVRFKLDKLENLFNSIKEKIQPDNYLAGNIQAALDAGYSREEIMNRLSEKGII